MALGLAQTTSHAGEGAGDAEQWNAKFQATYIWQTKPAFDAAYSGPHSLSPLKEKGYSFSATAALGFRPWTGGEAYLDAEGTQGVPFSNLTGLGGFTNSELSRTAGSALTLYRARAFLRQTWGLRGGSEKVDSEINQLAGQADKNRLVVTAGNLAVGDLFDDNAYSHDPRTQFMNGALITYGAYDSAADSRGYTWGAALEYFADGWAVRAGRFIQPKDPNGPALDPRIFRHYGDQIEVERAHGIAGQPGKLRVLAFRNRALMSRYADALQRAAGTGAAPDLDAVRNTEQTKVGIGLNLEQAITSGAGVFARIMRADGKTETYAYSEIDRSFSAGGSMKGAAWGRGADLLGLAVARNGISSVHAAYLAKGGLGFFVGDGRLAYRPEAILEAFYSWNLARSSAVTLDWQRIRNPAYNADRGPVTVISMRVHSDF
jgi:high affinity Mn2+ porin